jgi:hypothetical protein
VLAAARRWLGTGSRGEGSSLASLASACAVSRHLAVTGIQGELARRGAVPPARVVMRSALFGRLVISWESPGLSRPTRCVGRSSAATAAISPSPGSSSAGRTGARPSLVLLVCGSRSRSRSPAWDAMAPCSGRLGLPICICGQIAPPDRRVPRPGCDRARTKVRPAKEGGSRCHRSGRRRIRRQAGRARRGSPSPRKRPRAANSPGSARRSGTPRCERARASTRIAIHSDQSRSSSSRPGWCERQVSR